MIRWKDSCRFDDLRSVLVLAVLRADTIYLAEGVNECWITSVNDSTHMATSKHYDGRAVDLRTHNVPNPETVANILRGALGPQFTVLYEGAGTSNAHIHVQFNGR